MDSLYKCRTAYHFEMGEHGRITEVPQEVMDLDTALGSNMLVSRLMRRLDYKE